MTSAAIQDVRAMRRQLPALTSVLRKRDPPQRYVADQERLGPAPASRRPEDDPT
jgi:hypothetical protein